MASKSDNGRRVKSGLSPAQNEAFEAISQWIPLSSTFVLRTGGGSGRTTVLKALHDELGGAFLTMKEYIDALGKSNPLALEEVFEKLIFSAFEANDVVILDDLHLLTHVIANCGMTFYQRNNLLHASLVSIAAYAEASGKKLIAGTDEGGCPNTLEDRSYATCIDNFKVGDYEYLGSEYMKRHASRVEWEKVHRFAPKLSAHQLKNACVMLRDSAPDTVQFIDYLRSQQMASNVDLGEVQAVELSDLKGVDDVIQALEANIIIPLENDALAKELNIKPKRGVLLAGPPGTGKTTIGRALAHRLKSKFFMVDGTIITGTREFYQRIQQVFNAAKQNAPSIIFIDDSDVIFESSPETGLYRYLLTMLDGLESQSSGRICVMMTAMDVGSMPPALVRSGRIELWLETRLPDGPARTSILQQHLSDLPASIGVPDLKQIAAATEGMTGADIKRLSEDARILYAYDRAYERPLRGSTDYFMSAIETVRSNKEKYSQAESMARQRHPDRPSFFDMISNFMPDPAAEN